MEIILDMSLMVPMCVCASKIGPEYFHVSLKLDV
jgi:hypothetical protein